MQICSLVITLRASQRSSCYNERELDERASTNKLGLVTLLVFLVFFSLFGRRRLYWLVYPLTNEDLAERGRGRGESDSILMLSGWW